MTTPYQLVGATLHYGSTSYPVTDSFTAIAAELVTLERPAACLPLECLEAWDRDLADRAHSAMSRLSGGFNLRARRPGEIHRRTFGPTIDWENDDGTPGSVPTPVQLLGDWLTVTFDGATVSWRASPAPVLALDLAQVTGVAIR